MCSHQGDRGERCAFTGNRLHHINTEHVCMIHACDSRGRRTLCRWSESQRDIFQKGELFSPAERQRSRDDRRHLRLTATVTLGGALQPLNLQGHFSIAEKRHSGGKNDRKVSPAFAPAAAQQHCLCWCFHTVHAAPVAANTIAKIQTLPLIHDKTNRLVQVSFVLTFRLSGLFSIKVTDVCVDCAAGLWLADSHWWNTSSPGDKPVLGG